MAWAVCGQAREFEICLRGSGRQVWETSNQAGQFFTVLLTPYPGQTFSPPAKRILVKRDRLPWFWFFFTVAVLLLSAIDRYHIRHDAMRVREICQRQSTFGFHLIAQPPAPAHS